MSSILTCSCCEEVCCVLNILIFYARFNFLEVFVILQGILVREEISLRCLRCLLKVFSRLLSLKSVTTSSLHTYACDRLLWKAVYF